jgi:dethiobiotin synthetase
VVARNALGTINHVLQTLITAAAFRDGLDVAGIVLNRSTEVSDESARQNAAEIARRAVAPLLAELGFRATEFVPEVDWYALADLPARERESADED